MTTHAALGSVPAIRDRKLSKTSEDHGRTEELVALRDVNLDVTPGEVLAVVGASQQRWQETNQVRRGTA